MKTFSWFKKRKITKELQETEENLATLVQSTLEKVEVNTKSPVDRKEYIKENCEQIMETTRQMEEFHKEYEAVTSYLSDIQRIDQIPEKSREEIDDSARNLLMLTRERAKIQNGESKLTQKQYKVIETYEDEIVNEIKKINQKEAYQLALKKDLGHLEGEKASLLYDKETITKKQSYLKKVSVTVSVLVAILFVIFLGLTYAYSFDSKTPFLLTVVLAMVCVVIIVMESHKNQVGMALNDRKLKKVIGLINRVKIKYINNQCSLDYSYEKFMIKSSTQLTVFWEEYMKQKELEKKYKSNTELLNYYNEKLINDLKNYGIKDTEVWTHQCVALLDSKEMVEIRHRLNVRRQKLRDRCDYNVRMKDESLANIKQVLQENPSAKAEIVEALKKYNIEI